MKRLLTIFIAAHLFFIQLQGIHEPDAWNAHPEQRKTMPFFPHFFLRELLLVAQEQSELV